MLKKTITYTNLFTDQEVTEDHYFHISKADLIEMEITREGGMKEHLERVIASENGNAIMTEFKNLIKLAYGKKQGDRFIKSEEIWNEFYSSEAYSTLFSELCLNADKAAEFMNGIVPNNLEQEAAKVVAAVQQSNTENSSTSPREQVLANATPENPITLTQIDVVTMDSEVLKSGLANGRYKLA